MRKYFKFKHFNIKKFILLIILLCLYIFINAYSYVTQVSNDLSNNVFRLHVIANSNSTDDQNLKYIVRDKIIQYMNNLCKNSNSKEETITIISNHLNEFNQIANNTIAESGFNYTSSVEIGNFKFPTKNYEDISFPAGYYDALKIKLGDAQGQNWWCVLYPSLCFIDKTSAELSNESKKQLETNLNEEEYQLISNNDNHLPLTFKFKIIELFSHTN